MSSFRIPPALKAVFDSFPLKTLPNDPLPSGCPTPDPRTPSLYVFTTPEDAALGNPSFNPSCLKWQTYLNFCGIKFKIVPSNNHASPSGALPFLITPGTITSSAVPSSRLAQWARQDGGGTSPSETGEEEDEENPDAQVFQSLIDSKLRDAWLYALYIEPNNFQTLASAHYRSTSVYPVHLILSHQMQEAAKEQLLQGRPGGVIVAEDIYADAEEAVSALSRTLGDYKWFFNSKRPGKFDAALFGYLYLVLTLKWDEKEADLLRAVKKYDNLVGHVERVRSTLYPYTPSLFR